MPHRRRIVGLVVVAVTVGALGASLVVRLLDRGVSVAEREAERMVTFGGPAAWDAVQEVDLADTMTVRTIAGAPVVLEDNGLGITGAAVTWSREVVSGDYEQQCAAAASWARRARTTFALDFDPQAVRDGCVRTFRRGASVPAVPLVTATGGGSTSGRGSHLAASSFTDLGPGRAVLSVTLTYSHPLD